MAERTERDVLHHLIEICRDGEQGFRAAANDVGDPALRSLFAELSAEWRRFGEALVPHLQRMGGREDGNGTNVGLLHRRWLMLKGLVSGHHDHAVVTEAERVEHAALNAYEEALNGTVPPTVRELIETQRDAIRDANDRIRATDMAHS
jgi:uncharacterized protein (TIGR02284 family)